MTDRELPPLPPVDPTQRIPYESIRYRAGYRETYLKRYAEEYARAAIKLEHEACLAAIDDIEEKPWHGYENPNTFQDAKWAAMAAIRARSEDREGSLVTIYQCE